MSPLDKLSVIVPIAFGDESWKQLAMDLKALPPSTEILFVHCGPRPALREPSIHPGLRILSACPGRGKQLNAGARAAKGAFLWFVHADSRFGRKAIRSLENCLKINPEALHYFKLKFSSDGPRWMALNELGARIRSQWLRLPFGDQAFCISRAGYERVGGFREDLPYGEDHLFVWSARRQGIALRCTGEPLETSARRYRDRGWASTTARHLSLTLKQALPEIVASLRFPGTQEKKPPPSERQMSDC